ncbi:hypothetical protein HYS54_02700 [Candidatus Micrarchaeota archaeon]|nr:hypothetical protein [Candidatus Micrarchaeota archaeon]
MAEEQPRTPVYYLVTENGPSRTVGVGLPARRGKEHLVGVLDLGSYLPAGVNPSDFLADFYPCFEMIERKAFSSRGLVCQLKIQEDCLDYVQELDAPRDDFVRFMLAQYVQKPPEPVVYMSRVENLWAARFRGEREVRKRNTGR